MKKEIKMTKTQQNDNTNGLITVTYPLVQKLKSGSSSEIELAQIAEMFTSLICDVRSIDAANNQLKTYTNELERISLLSEEEKIHRSESVEMYKSIVESSTSIKSLCRDSKEMAKMQLIKMISSL